MPYAQLSDVQSMCPSFPINAQSKPSSTDVQTFISDVEAEVDSALVNLGYTVPITGTRAVKTVKKIVVFGALAQTLMAVAAGRSKPEDIGQDKAKKEYRDYLDRLADPDDLTLELTDAGRTDEELEKTRSGIIESHAQGLTEDEFADDEPSITRNQTF